MDSIAIAASLGGLLQVTRAVIDNFGQYKYLPEELTGLMAEARALYEVIQTILKYLATSQQHELDKTLEITIYSCRSAINLILSIQVMMINKK
jgi:hypothetical protein